MSEQAQTRDANREVELSVEGAIATLTLNNPARHNALSGDNILQVRQFLDSVAAQTDIRVLILAGRGDKTFCAGAALDQLGSGAIDGDQFTAMTDQLAALTIPTICAFNGSAYGGGSELGLACDFRIGIEGMRVFVPPARIGLCYPVNGIQRFVRVLGPSTAKRLLLASEDFGTQELLRVGYLTHLVGRDTLDDTVQALAARMAGYAPLALRAMKQICDSVSGAELDREAAQQLAQACNDSQDLQEGLLAHRQKRKPDFRGC